MTHAKTVIGLFSKDLEQSFHDALSLTIFLFLWKTNCLLIAVFYEDAFRIMDIVYSAIDNIFHL